MSPRPPPLEFLTACPDETLALGVRLGRLLHAGDVLALVGPLGAGKTLLVKGLARGLDVPPDEPIVSPTFVLVREYPGRLTLLHCDAYRLAAPDELDDLGLLEGLAERGAVVALEWADRFPERVPAGAWWIEIEPLDGDRRRLLVTAPDEANRDKLSRNEARA